MPIARGYLTLEFQRIVNGKLRYNKAMYLQSISSDTRPLDIHMLYAQRTDGWRKP